MTAEECAALLRQKDNILILTHRRPDGDTVGSAAGLCAALRQLGKTAYLHPNPEITEVNRPYAQPYWAPAGFAPDFVVSVDIAARQLFYPAAEGYLDRVDLAVDHHPSQEFFARATCLEADKAACGEIVYRICRALGEITPAVALPLYAAVATDTGCFVYANTTPHTPAVAAALMRTGIDYRAVNKLYFRTKSRKQLQMESAMMRECLFYDRDRVAILSVPLTLMERYQAAESDAEDLSALGPQIAGVDCAVTMRELRPGVWKLSLRTGPRINATEVCRELGGGGHAAAAGCTVECGWEEARDRILEAIARHAPDFVR